VPRLCNTCPPGSWLRHLPFGEYAARPHAEREFAAQPPPSGELATPPPYRECAARPHAEREFAAQPPPSGELATPPQTLANK
jgi:hypothetical protein